MTISKPKAATAVVLGIGFAGTALGWVVVPGKGPAAVVAVEPPKLARPQAQAPVSAIEEQIKELEKKFERHLKATEPRVVQAGPESPAVRILTEALDRLTAEKAIKSKAHEEFLKSVQVNQPPNGQNLYLQRLSKIDRKRSDVRDEIAELIERLSQLRALMNKKGKAATVQWVTQLKPRVDNDDIRKRINQKIAELEIAKKRLLQKVGPQHQSVVDLEEFISMVRDSRPQSGADEVVIDSIETYISVLATKMSVRELLLKSLDAMYEGEMKTAKAIDAEARKDLEFREEIGRLQAAISSVNKALQELRIAPGSAMP